MRGDAGESEPLLRRIAEEFGMRSCRGLLPARGGDRSPDDDGEGSPAIENAVRALSDRGGSCSLCLLRFFSLFRCKTLAEGLLARSDRGEPKCTELGEVTPVLDRIEEEEKAAQDARRLSVGSMLFLADRGGR